MAVSVDSLNPPYHDRFRHGTGALADTLAAVDRLNAAELDFIVQTTVTRGNRTGHALGFPTANLDVENEILPTPGVYAVTAEFDGIPRTGGVANLGHRLPYDLDVNYARYVPGIVTHWRPMPEGPTT